MTLEDTQHYIILEDGVFELHNHDGECKQVFENINEFIETLTTL